MPVILALERNRLLTFHVLAVGDGLIIAHLWIQADQLAGTERDGIGALGIGIPGFGGRRFLRDHFFLFAGGSRFFLVVRLRVLRAAGVVRRILRKRSRGNKPQRNQRQREHELFDLIDFHGTTTVSPGWRATFCSEFFPWTTSLYLNLRRDCLSSCVRKTTMLSFLANGVKPPAWAINCRTVVCALSE